MSQGVEAPRAYMGTVLDMSTVIDIEEAWLESWKQIKDTEEKKYVLK